jgi:stromal membrane-associated protein
MRNTGNVKSNQHYNADEVRNPPPTNMVDSERDGELEKFIRSA